MKAQFTLAVVAALASLVAAAPQRTEAVHKTARLRMTTINGDILDQLVNTGGDGRGQGARRTRSKTPDAPIEKLEIIGVDGKSPTYVFCSAHDKEGELLGYTEGGPAGAYRDTEGFSWPMYYEHGVNIFEFECVNWWGD